MGDISPERKPGCCFASAVLWRRRANKSNHFVKASNNTHNSKRPQGGSEPSVPKGTVSSKPTTDSSSRSTYSKPTPVVNQNQQRNHPIHTTAGGTSKVSPNEGYVNNGRKVVKEAIGISGELETMISDHQNSKGSSTLLRASSSNVMLAGNLGNLRQGGNTNNSYNVNVTKNHNATPQREEKQTTNNNKVGNVDIKKSNNKQQTGSLCRAVSTRMDPEQLKIMGNEDYKSGRFAEALALYDAAIAIDPNKASYRSNKSAALTALGRILEAVFECREAIRIEPHYQRAHQRLGSLCMRLGDTDKALYHYKKAGAEADPDDLAKIKNIQVHLNKCTEARRLGDWNTLIEETNSVISSGANSAPHIFALQAEALLKLRRHQDAEEAMSKGSNFDVDDCTKFFGPIANANFLVTRAQVDLAAGRFEDALDALQRAARLDSNNREGNKVMRRARALAHARSNGNELFKASKFSEACIAYGEGLEYDPNNSVLLCNRAACRSKLGQFEKAVEDCTAALNLRPSYRKARLRRADCNAKLKQWEASIQDYEILLKETPDDEEVNRALLEAKEQIKAGR